MMRTRNWLLLAAWLISGGALADWSPEIVLWENLANIPARTMQACVAVDEQERVHIVYQHAFGTGSPMWVRDGLSYVRFNDHGYLEVSERFISDSVELVNDTPTIACFGTDSLWAMWYCVRQDSPWVFGQRTRTLDGNGEILGSPRTWTVNVPGDFVLRSLPDRTVVFAHVSRSDQTWLTVEQPGGHRMVDTVVWSREGQTCDELHGFVDATDSLQLVWRQRGAGDAIYAKRVAVGAPFDPCSLGDYAVLTPEEPGVYYSTARIAPAGDSLLVVGIAHPEEWCTYYLHVFQRDSYQEIAQVRLGMCPTYPRLAVEGDSVVGVFSYPDQGRSLYFQRYSLPYLELLEDTLLVEPDEIDGYIGLKDYVVSPSGVRHVLYDRRYTSYRAMMCYRYWRSDLSVPGRASPVSRSDFQVYPNPANSMVTLLGPHEVIHSLVLYNILGQAMNLSCPLQGQFASDGMPLDLSALSSEAYFLRIQTRTYTAAVRVVLIR